MSLLWNVKSLKSHSCGLVFLKGRSLKKIFSLPENRSPQKRVSVKKLLYSKDTLKRCVSARVL